MLGPDYPKYSRISSVTVVNKLKSKDQIWEGHRVDTSPRFSQIHPEDSKGDPETTSRANLVNAVTRSMAIEGERNNQAQVQPDSNQGQGLKFFYKL
uniref:Uncharacterized protein n=1 Tax=Romanomermis culicivorax TaxID=13658 RepID=A0A915KJW7_ROMCU